MPISGPASYLPTIETFLNHWAAVDAALGAKGPLVLAAATPGGPAIGRADLGAMRDALESARDAVTDAGVDRSLARGRLVGLTRSLQGRLVDFNGRVRADLPGSAIANALPVAFSVGDAEGGVRDGLRQMSRLWAAVNALSPVPAWLALPLTLKDDDYALAEFETDRGRLRDAYRGLSDAEVDLALARGRRNVLQDAIYDVLKLYRQKVPTALANGDALVGTLPVLTPAAGHTPAAVKALGTWEAAEERARLTWEASAEAGMDHYEVRGVAGNDYVADDEVVLASVAPGAAREFATEFALGVPGLTAGFKVYVVLRTGNERGSEPVYVSRPG